MVKPKIQGRVHVDEKFLRVKGIAHYDLNGIDSKSKYVLAHSFVKHRTKKKVVNFMRQIKLSCYDQILERHESEKHKPYKERNLICFVSDKFQNYRKGFNKLFYGVARLKFGVPIACKKYGLEHNNNPIERYNQDIEQRYKVMRGFNGFESASAFLEMKRIIHNYVNPHMELKGMTPAEKAEIKLPLGRNKLLSLIKYAYLTKN